MKRKPEQISQPAGKKPKHALASKTNETQLNRGRAHGSQQTGMPKKFSKPRKYAASKGPMKGGKPAFKSQDGGKPAFKGKAAGDVQKKEPKQLLTRQDRKRMREEKLSKKKNYPLAKELTTRWEKIRQHDVSKEDRATLVNEVMDKVKGKVAELASNHVTSRVLQACAKYGTAAHRASMLSEVLPHFVTMAKSPYGHFTLKKLVATAPKASIPAMLKAVRSQVPTLLRHPTGCTVLEELYDVSSGAQRDTLMAEFYGREYLLFDLPQRGPGGTGGLEALWEQMDAAKKRTVLAQMGTHVIPIVEKGLVHSALTHRLLYDYMLHAPGGALDDIITTLSGEIMMRYVHTRHGAAVGCMVLAYGTPKYRKKTLKAMKPHVKTMAVDEFASLVLITALQVVDDTALARKSIVAELQTELAEYARHRWAHRVLLALLAPSRPRHWPPSMRSVIQPPVKMTSAHKKTAQQTDEATDGQTDDQVNGQVDGRTDEGVEQTDEGSDGELGIMDDEFGTGDEETAVEAEMEAAEEPEEADLSSDSDEFGGPNEGPLGAPSGVLGASKKDPRVRRVELLSGDKSGGPGGLGMKLLEAACEGPGSWLCTGPGCAIIEEIALGSEDGVLTEVCGGLEGLLPLHKAIAEAATTLPDVETDGQTDGQPKKAQKANGKEPTGPAVPLVDFFGSRTLRRMVTAGGSDEGGCKEAAQQLAEQLWKISLSGRCKQWVGTHAEKILRALLQCTDLSVYKAVKKEIGPLLPVEQ